MADLPLDKAAADRAVGIYNYLRLPDVPGQPLLAEAGGEWFRDLVRAAFGSADPETGERHVREIFCLVPKKNSKTTNSAALGLVALLMNQTPNLEMLIMGPTKEVAETCFGQAKGMIKADRPEDGAHEAYLSNRFHIRDDKQSIVDRLNGSILKICAFDVRVITGSIPALTIIDELHVLGSSHKAAGVLAQIRGGMITRPDALLLFITTQSDNVPAGSFASELAYARGVRDGKIKGGNVLPCLYEFPEDMQRSEERLWRDPKVWPMVLPNLGKSITLERLVRLYDQAVEKGPGEEIIWASQHLNIEIGLGLHANRWVGVDHWAKNARRMNLSELLSQVDVAVCGGDIGGADDLFGFAVIGRHKETRAWLGWVRAWATPYVLKRRKEIAPRLLGFEQDGDLIITQTAQAHVQQAADICEQVRDAGVLPDQNAIGLDPYGVAALCGELELRGFTMGTEVIGVSQGWKLNGAVKGLERRLLDGLLHHADQPLMDWCVSNAKSEQRGNNVYITKQAAGVAKIDPLMALINAAVLMDMNPASAKKAISIAANYRVA